MTPRAVITDEELHAFIDGQLDRVRATEIGMMAQIDPELAARIAAFRADIDAIARHFGPVGEQPLPPAWLNRIRRGRAWHARLLRRRGALAAAAGLAAAMVGGVALRWWRDRDDTLVADAIAARSRPLAAGTGDLAALRQSADRAVRQAVGATVRAPDMSALGFVLAAVDIDNGAFGRRVVRLDYRDDRARLFTLFVRPSSGQERFEMIRRGQTRICVWQDEVLSTIMLAEVSAGEMLRLASLAYNNLRA